MRSHALHLSGTLLNPIFRFFFCTFVSRCPGNRFWPQTQPGHPDWYYNNCESVPSPNISFMGYTVRDQQFRYTGARRTLHCWRTHLHVLLSLTLDALTLKNGITGMAPTALQSGTRSHTAASSTGRGENRMQRHSLVTQLILTLLQCSSIGLFIRSHEDEDFYPLDFDATENENIVTNATYATV